MNKLFVTAIVFCASLLVTGCATNPVTGKRELMIFSDAQEAELGKKTKEQVILQYGLYKSPALEEYISVIGRKIAAVSDRKNIEYSFVVLDTSTVNAFAAPGGYIFLTKGILKALKDESELSSVIGHEIGHVAARHSMKALQKQYGYQVVMQLGGILANADMSALAPYTDFLANLAFLGYGRENEFQADRLGLKYSVASGYDPQGMLDFFEQLQTLEGGDKRKTSVFDKFFMSHPPTKDRIAELQKYKLTLPKLSSVPLVINEAAYQSYRRKL